MGHKSSVQGSKDQTYKILKLISQSKKLIILDATPIWYNSEKKNYRDQIQFWHKQKNQTKKFKLNTLRYSYTVFFFSLLSRTFYVGHASFKILTRGLWGHEK